MRGEGREGGKARRRGREGERERERERGRGRDGEEVLPPPWWRCQHTEETHVDPAPTHTHTHTHTHTGRQT